MSETNGVTVSTAWFSLQGPGMFIVVILLVCSVIYSMLATQESLRLTQQEHAAIVRSINDVFLAVLVTPEQKQNLPPIMKEKVEEKVKQKAESKLAQE